MSDFKESGFMYMIGGLLVVFVIAQSLFFLIKAWKQGKKLGISTATLKNTVVSSSLFSIAPAISILATVIVLANALGLVLPWIRLTVIGNLAYETVTATNALEVFGMTLTSEITDPKIFAAVAWVMTVGSVFPLILLPIVIKKVQSKMGKVADKNTKWADLMSAAAFIGIISAFIARALNGAGDPEKNVSGDGAGVMSVSVLVSAVVFMLLLNFICKKFKLKWLEPFALPISMFAAMGVAIILAHFAPDAAAIEWRY